MDIKRFLVATLAVIAAGIMIGIGGLIVFGVFMAAMVLGLLGLATSLLLMSPEQRTIWFARVKNNLKGWVRSKTAHNKTAASKTAKSDEDKRLP